jgi:predicted permease
MILVPRGEKKQSIFKSLLNPIFISILIGAALGLTGAVEFIPSFALKTIDYCKASMAPVAMILTGFVIGGYNIKSLLNDKKIYIASGLRLVIFPAVFLTLLYLAGSALGIETELLRLALTLTLFAYATPLGLNTVVFPAAYGGDTKTGASMAMISHTLCVITIPIMYALLTGVLDRIM